MSIFKAVLHTEFLAKKKLFFFPAREHVKSLNSQKAFSTDMVSNSARLNVF